jgi:hypothetical protein
MERGSGLARRVCDEKLFNAQPFTDDDGLVLFLSRFATVNPCDRVGPILGTMTYFQRALSNCVKWVTDYLVRDRDSHL